MSNSIKIFSNIMRYQNENSEFSQSHEKKVNEMLESQQSSSLTFVS